MVSYVQSLLANFVSAFYRITRWPPQKKKKKKKKKISFFLFPAPLGQICFVLVLISPNHKARNRYPEMVMARTGNYIVLIETADYNEDLLNLYYMWSFLL